MKKSTKIYIAGHRGMVGSAVWRALEKKGYSNLIGRTSKELDLKNQQSVLDFFERENPAKTPKISCSFLIMLLKSFCKDKDSL